MAILVLLLSPLSVWAGRPFSIRPPASGMGIDPQAMTVIGSPQQHVIRKDENLQDIAWSYDLGCSEIGAMYRHWDPFLPPAGANMLVPTRWIVPTTGHSVNRIIANRVQWTESSVNSAVSGL